VLERYDPDRHPRHIYLGVRYQKQRTELAELGDGPLCPHDETR
jgi:hypothetical protein